MTELSLLGNKTRHSQVATDVAVYFDSELRKLKLQSISQNYKVLAKQR